MPEYGLKILNDSLKLQIDSLYTNYFLYEHGENVNTVDQGDQHWATVNFANPTSQPPLIAIKPDTDDYCGGSVGLVKSGSNYTGFVLDSEDKVVTFSWQAFVPRIDKSAEGYGLRAYNASNVLCFDSGHTPMGILTVNTANPAYNAVQTLTHVSDANAYHITSPNGIIMRISEWNGTYSTVRYFVPMIKKLSSTQISFGGVQSAQGSIPAQFDITRGYWPALWTIITVRKAF